MQRILILSSLLLLAFADNERDRAMKNLHMLTQMNAAFMKMKLGDKCNNFRFRKVGNLDSLKKAYDTLASFANTLPEKIESLTKEIIENKLAYKKECAGLSSLINWTLCKALWKESVKRPRKERNDMEFFVKSTAEVKSLLHELESLEERCDRWKKASDEKKKVIRAWMKRTSK